MPENQDSKLFIPETDLAEVSPVSPVVKLPEAAGVVTINIDELKENSVVVIKIAPEGMQQRMAATQQIAMALRPLRESIKKKNIAFIVMSTQEDMSVLDPEQMEGMGWVKKEESRIIIPK